MQIRGYRIQLPLDVMLFASANPEDYTNRGRIITPLKDRFGTQIRTHYPLEIDTEIDIIDQEATPFSADGVDVTVPDFMAEVVATMSHLARDNPHVNQRSGVSVRLSISNYETLVASAVRRTLRTEGTKAVPRVADLPALTPSTMGKIEIESMDEGRDAEIIQHLLQSAVLVTFKDALEHEDVRGILDAFEETEVVVHTGDDIADSRLSGDGRVDAGARQRPHRTRVRPRRSERCGAGRERGRVHPRGSAPVEAAQQGSPRRQRRLPQSLIRRPHHVPPAAQPSGDYRRASGPFVERGGMR